MRSYKGLFKPRNWKKYKGDPTKIIYRSSWEKIAMKKLDENPNVLEWSSEEFIIPYISPLDNAIHRYFPDLYVKALSQGKIVEMIIEIKPESQVKQPRARKRITQKFIAEAATWSVNQAKWEAARLWCKERGWQFQVRTEKDLGIKHK